MISESEKLLCIFPTLSGCDLTIEDMDLEISVRNTLCRRGIRNLTQLLLLSHSELLHTFPNRNLRSYEDVIHGLVYLSEELEGTDTAAPNFTSTTDISTTVI